VISAKSVYVTAHITYGAQELRPTPAAQYRSTAAEKRAVDRAAPPRQDGRPEHARLRSLAVATMASALLAAAIDRLNHF
jgi:hypothetical protein